ncbi:MAG: Gfo/Idh/MocA family oxidoreductase [Chloroflexi bacterium]|nr:Gfo/Idh/MocA family oxidoreductase [Chloroflexota bacterium]
MPGESSRLSASVVGGGAGGQLSMRALMDSDRFDLQAAADLRADVRDELGRKFPGIQTFGNHTAMFDRRPTDVVCVSTYPPGHETVTMDALALPLRGILVEKPLGHTAASGRRILDAIRERGLPMAVPHGMLVQESSAEVIDRVRRGEIGSLKLVEIQCTNWDIINAGVHWLNFFVALTGQEPVDSVMAQCDSSTRTYRDGMQVETAAVTYAQTLTGIRMVMNTGDHVKIARDGKNTLFRIVGSSGQVECWGWDDSYILQNEQWPGGRVFTPEKRPGTYHQRHLEAMAAAIDKGAPDYSIPESSLLALEICEAAYISNRFHCQVKLPLESFRPLEAIDWDPGSPYSGTDGGRDGRKLGPQP